MAKMNKSSDTLVVHLDWLSEHFLSLQFLDDAEEENHGDPDVENYLADFFGHTSDNTDAKSQNVAS